MKKILLFAATIPVAINVMFAAVHTVMVSNYQFSPKTVNAVVGDRIRWVWVNGRHTTTSTNIPGAANPWDRPINRNNQTFVYTLTVAGVYRYKCTPHASAGMTGVIRVANPLEAGLTNFAVNDANPNALITWNTISSKDLAYFSVQKSTDGENFGEIAKVYPDASNHYKFTDNNKSSSKYIYYQVEMVNTKNERQLSEIKIYQQKDAATRLITNISPNPIDKSGHLMLQFNSDKEGTMLVRLYSEAGVLVKQTQMTASIGLNNGHFHLGDLKSGAYYIVCTLGKATEKHTVIVK